MKLLNINKQFVFTIKTKEHLPCAASSYESDMPTNEGLSEARHSDGKQREM